METETKTSVKDFFVNLGSIVALGVIITNLINLLFTIINKTYPVTTRYDYYGTESISFPVATLIIFFPIYILLMWLLERSYAVFPEQRHMGVRKWLTFITLFAAGLAIAGDLVTVIYYFIDGRDITAGFMMKVLSVLVVAFATFFYYISDVMGKLNKTSRKVWTGVSFLIILISIIWGFSVLGSPRAQRLLKYDGQKINDLQSINNQIMNYYSNKGILPKTLKEIADGNYYITEIDPQSQKLYEYKKINDTTYNLCAEFNKDTNSFRDNPVLMVNDYGGRSWTHPAGHYCFSKTINPNTYTKPTLKN